MSLYTIRSFVLLGSLCAAFTSPASSDDLSQLGGEWRASEGVFNGKAPTQKELSDIRMEFKATLDQQPSGSITLVPPLIPAGSEPVFGGFFPCYLDLKKSPRVIHFIRMVGGKGATYPGIFELQGDTLKVCFALEPWDSFPGLGDRVVPNEFGSTEKSGLALLTLKKVKR